MNSKGICWHPAFYLRRSFANVGGAGEDIVGYLGLLELPAVLIARLHVTVHVHL